MPIAHTPPVQRGASAARSACGHAARHALADQHERVVLHTSDATSRAPSAPVSVTPRRQWREPMADAKPRHGSPPLGAKQARHGGKRKAALVRAHEPEEPDGTAPVSRANQAAALERMCVPPGDCLFSRRNRANSSRADAAQSPNRFSRRHSCLSAAATHAPIDCAVGSNPRQRSSADRPARTRSTIRRRNSGEYGGRVWALGTPLLKASGCPRSQVNPTNQSGGGDNA